jgi:hypothetical protein
MKSYVGLTGAKPERAKLFACPADTFYWDYENGWISQSLHQQPRFYYSSYGFNGGNFLSGEPPVSRWPGIAGRKLSSIREPVKTVLVIEFAALLPYSWHEPARVSHYNNARDMAGFVDGHASFIKMFWNAAKTNGIEAWHYDPPTGSKFPPSPLSFASFFFANSVGSEAMEACRVDCASIIEEPSAHLPGNFAPLNALLFGCVFSPSGYIK